MGYSTTSMTVCSLPMYEFTKMYCTTVLLKLWWSKSFGSSFFFRDWLRFKLIWLHNSVRDSCSLQSNSPWLSSAVAVVGRGCRLHERHTPRKRGQIRRRSERLFISPLPTSDPWSDIYCFNRSEKTAVVLKLFWPKYVSFIQKRPKWIVPTWLKKCHMSSLNSAICHMSYVFCMYTC